MISADEIYSDILNNCSKVSYYAGSAKQTNAYLSNEEKKQKMNFLSSMITESFLFCLAVNFFTINCRQLFTLFVVSRWRKVKANISTYY